ncbi:MAG TPA: GNAT family N-acetyltransferase [Patescibacteria group bacterium]|nr:GNAT family N-acetyltransferase [Patescibacteria group bacterium]
MNTPEGIDIIRFDGRLSNLADLQRTALGVQQLLHSVLVEHYEEALGLPVNTHMYDPESNDKVLGRIRLLVESGNLAKLGGTVYWLARDAQADNLLVGICQLKRLDRRMVELQDFDVLGPSGPGEDDPGYRGRGIGRAMLQLAMRDPDIRRKDTMRLEVVQGNPTRSLYERLGFEPTGRAKHYGRAFRRTQDRPPVMHEEMLAPVPVVRDRLSHRSRHERPRREAASGQPSPEALGTSIGQVAAGLEAVRDQHIPQLVRDITGRIAQIEARIAVLQASMNEQNRQQIESQIEALQNSQNSLVYAQSRLNEGDTSVVKRLGWYLGTTIGSDSTETE